MNRPLKNLIALWPICSLMSHVIHVTLKSHLIMQQQTVRPNTIVNNYNNDSNI